MSYEFIATILKLSVTDALPPGTGPNSGRSWAPWLKLRVRQADGKACTCPVLSEPPRSVPVARLLLCSVFNCLNFRFYSD